MKSSMDKMHTIARCESCVNTIQGTFDSKEDTRPTSRTTTSIATAAVGMNSQDGSSAANSTTVVAGNGLYEFSSFDFLSANKTGRDGPSLSECRTFYAGNGATAAWTQDLINKYFDMSTNGIQLWTVPATGSYTIRAVGAGSYLSGQSSISWGRGIDITTSTTLTKGEVIKILVGQKGTGNNVGGYPTSGGGGGTFVVKDVSNAIIVAGGGGSRGSKSVPNMSIPSSDASSNINGNNGGVGTTGTGGLGGTNGGGGSNYLSNGGSGGGGLIGNGVSNPNNYGTGGSSFINGGNGGDLGPLGDQYAGGLGGFGARVTSTLNVQPGQVLQTLQEASLRVANLSK